MKQDHPVDTLIQEYVLDRSNCPGDAVEHIQHCEKCTDLATTYKLLFGAIKELPEPGFGPGFESAVLKQLNPVKPKVYSDFIFVLAALLVIVVFSIVIFYSFQNTLLQWFESIQPQAIYLSVFTVTLVLVLQCVELYKNYKQKMDALELM